MSIDIFHMLSYRNQALVWVKVVV